MYNAAVPGKNAKAFVFTGTWTFCSKNMTHYVRFPAFACLTSRPCDCVSSYDICCQGHSKKILVKTKCCLIKSSDFTNFDSNRRTGFEPAGCFFLYQNTSDLLPCHSTAGIRFGTVIRIHPQIQSFSAQRPCPALHPQGMWCRTVFLCPLLWFFYSLFSNFIVPAFNVLFSIVRKNAEQMDFRGGGIRGIKAGVFFYYHSIIKRKQTQKQNESKHKSKAKKDTQKQSFKTEQKCFRRRKKWQTG